MAEASRSRVTITLGRSGQVVKRAGVQLDGSFPESEPAVGRKRSARDRLGYSADSTSQLNSKRQRGESRLSMSASNYTDDKCLEKDDLRYKIMRKHMVSGNQRDVQQNDVDLRDFLSRPAQSSASSPSTRQRIPESESSRLQFAEPRYSRQQMSEPRDGRHQISDLRDHRPQKSELRDPRVLAHEFREPRQHSPRPRDVRHGMSMPLRDPRHGMSEPKGSSIMGVHPTSRGSSAFPQPDSLRNSYSPWTLDRLRKKSPTGILGTSRGLSPPRIDEALRRRPPAGTYSDVRVDSSVRKDVYDFSRPMSSSSFMSKPVPPLGPMKTAPQMLAPRPPPGGPVQTSSYVIGDQPTIDGFLHSLGLEKYVVTFKAEEVDMYTLSQMGEKDLKELGIPMGPRKKILLALMSRAKRQI